MNKCNLNIRQSSLFFLAFPEVSIAQDVESTIESTLCIPLLSMLNQEAWVEKWLITSKLSMSEPCIDILALMDVKRPSGVEDV